jgi:hypothetical protein
VSARYKMNCAQCRAKLDPTKVNLCFYCREDPYCEECAPYNLWKPDEPRRGLGVKRTSCIRCNDLLYSEQKRILTLFKKDKDEPK